MDTHDDAHAMTPQAVVPPAFADGLLRLCQGEFDFRMPRTLARDEPDMVAFFFNAIAEEIERLVTTSRDQETRLAETVDRLSNALTRVAAGEFEGVEVERDFRGDGIDVLVFLVNNTVQELGRLLAEKESRADQDRRSLQDLVAEGEKRLVASKESFRRLFEVAPQPLVLFDLDSFRVRDCNRRAADLFGLGTRELESKKATDLFEGLDGLHEVRAQLLRGETVEGVELRMRSASGATFFALVGASLVATADGEMCVAGFTDLTEQKKVEEQLREAATTDALTGTLRRGRLFEVSHHEWSRAKRYGRPVCVALLDLDHFKTINDRFGHLAGDECLRRVGACLLATVRREDWVGRFGGEEFAIVFPETRLDAAGEAAERIRLAVAALDVRVDDVRIPLAISGGVVERRTDEGFEEALGRADTALYEAKSLGRDRLVVVRG